MKKLLVIETSPNGKKSSSREMTEALVSKLKAVGDLEITRRDLIKQPLPHVGQDTVAAYFIAKEVLTPSQRKDLELSNQLVDELLRNDIVIIGAPMWNFNIPSVLKAWIDHVVRAGRTFSFSEKGLEGLVKGKKVYLVVSSGSVFTEGPFQTYDFQVPYLKTVLGFIGVTDIEVIRAEGTNDPARQKNAVEKAKHTIEKITA